jgi:hypothetical protein
MGSAMELLLWFFGSLSVATARVQARMQGFTADRTA